MKKLVSLIIGLAMLLGCASIPPAPPGNSMRVTNKTDMTCNFGFGIVNEEFSCADTLKPGQTVYCDFYEGDWFFVWQCGEDFTAKWFIFHADQDQIDKEQALGHNYLDIMPKKEK